ncbi:hypothetical protein ACVME8_006376 [Bradyrhizobium diazoefficiens]
MPGGESLRWTWPGPCSASLEPSPHHECRQLPTRAARTTASCTSREPAVSIGRFSFGDFMTHRPCMTFGRSLRWSGNATARLPSAGAAASRTGGASDRCDSGAHVATSVSANRRSLFRRSSSQHAACGNSTEAGAVTPPRVSWRASSSSAWQRASRRRVDPRSHLERRSPVFRSYLRRWGAGSGDGTCLRRRSRQAALRSASAARRTPQRPELAATRR